MTQPLIDRFGRRHNNLRISVTDRCNIRCTYCMPETVEFLPKNHLLTFEEIAHFVRIAADMGVDKLRLTGGEPLVRKDLPKLVEMLVRIPGIRSLGLTTNAVLLRDQAKPLYEAGLRRINISLDTLDPEQFRVITRRDLFSQVMDGIDAARQAGFNPIKINALAMKGVTDDQVVPLARFCREKGLELRFIEFMPLEADQIWDRSKVLAAEDLLRILDEAGLKTVPADGADPHAPAAEFNYADGVGKMGIIASVTRPFCGACNRLRLTAEGTLRNCLFSLEEVDVKGPMRSGADDAAIGNILRDCVEAKWEGHQINTAQFLRPERTMHAIGG